MVRDIMITEPQFRWWEFPLRPLAPNPSNVNYACDQSLGNPDKGGCEAGLFSIIGSDNMVVDPGLGLVAVKSGEYSSQHIWILLLELKGRSGNCAISVKATERHSVPWDMLRGVAENLLTTCASPTSIGGRATAQTGGRSVAKRTMRFVRRSGIGQYHTTPRT